MLVLQLLSDLLRKDLSLLLDGLVLTSAPIAIIMAIDCFSFEILGVLGRELHRPTVAWVMAHGNEGYLACSILLNVSSVFR